MKEDDDDHSVPLKIRSAVHRPIRDCGSMKAASMKKCATPTREPHLYNFKKNEEQKKNDEKQRR